MLQGKIKVRQGWGKGIIKNVNPEKRCTSFWKFLDGYWILGAMMLLISNAGLSGARMAT